jgi:hypothetical protein
MICARLKAVVNMMLKLMVILNIDNHDEDDDDERQNDVR